jgi:TonB family protein
MMHKKKKNFIKVPEYPGGKKAFDLFIKENLKYPDEAIKNKIEGNVLLGYNVNDNGEITDVEIIKPLGYGCDEEALRLIGLLKYGKPQNKGIRVNAKMKTSINFKLAAMQINYTVKEETNKKTSTYTIQLKI